MSRFPRLNLRNLKQPSKPPSSTPTEFKEATIPKHKHSAVFRYIFLFMTIIIFSILVLLFIPSGAIRRMKRLKCSQSSVGYVCNGEDYGDLIIKSSKNCMDDMYDINGIPFNIAKRGEIFRVPSKSRIVIHDASPHCTLDVFHDSKEDTFDYEFTWITTADHTEFTVYDGSYVIMDRVASEFIEHTVQGKWIAYTFKGTNVKGNGNTPIYTFTGTRF